MMLRFKQILITLCFLFTLQWASFAQQRNFEVIENKKIAYITKELKLTPAESQKFFPIYNQYNQEIWDLKKAKRGLNAPQNTNSFNGKRDVIAFDAKEVDVKKVYRSKFGQIIGQARASQFFQVEEDFINMLAKEYKSRPKK
ncbi:hypothetical protein FAZ15_21060 [Sphingobacterium olei]|uniref:GLPGLI family protein n=2 Tax=Sphingobacterium olei TaxID=2571155 RepID=A0A4U0NAX4_9SPHI|nr:hypothetical protein FAZ15_21060 [Sphingobacterium olei]